MKKRPELFQAVERALLVHSMSEVDEMVMENYVKSKVLDLGSFGVALKTKCKARYQFYIEVRVRTLMCDFNIHE